MAPVINTYGTRRKKRHGIPRFVYQDIDMDLGGDVFGALHIQSIKVKKSEALKLKNVEGKKKYKENRYRDVQDVGDAESSFDRLLREGPSHTYNQVNSLISRICDRTSSPQFAEAHTPSPSIGCKNALKKGERWKMEGKIKLKQDSIFLSDLSSDSLSKEVIEQSAKDLLIQRQTSCILQPASSKAIKVKKSDALKLKNVEGKKKYKENCYQDVQDVGDAESSFDRLLREGPSHNQVNSLISRNCDRTSSPQFAEAHTPSPSIGCKNALKKGERWKMEGKVKLKQDSIFVSDLSSDSMLKEVIKQSAKGPPIQRQTSCILTPVNSDAGKSVVFYQRQTHSKDCVPILSSTPLKEPDHQVNCTLSPIIQEQSISESISSLMKLVSVSSLKSDVNNAVSSGQSIISNYLGNSHNCNADNSSKLHVHDVSQKTFDKQIKPGVCQISDFALTDESENFVLSEHSPSSALEMNEVNEAILNSTFVDVENVSHESNQQSKMEMVSLPLNGSDVCNISERIQQDLSHTCENDLETSKICEGCCSSQSHSITHELCSSELHGDCCKESMLMQTSSVKDLPQTPPGLQNSCSDKGVTRETNNTDEWECKLILKRCDSLGVISSANNQALPSQNLDLSSKNLSIPLRAIDGSELLVLKSGKQWRRSLSVLSRARASGGMEPNVRQEARNDSVGMLEEESVTNDQDITFSGRYGEKLNSSDSAIQMVLKQCDQSEPLPFTCCYPPRFKNGCQKIGEGVYGEVFMYSGEERCEPAVIKIVPIEGGMEVNGEPQKRFEEIISEILIAQKLTELRNDSINSTSTFNKLQKVKCVKGKYPDWLIDLWIDFDNTKGSENDPPSMFSEDQLFIVLELAHGGKDLESFVFSSAQQALAAFHQVSLALAVAESALKFEHRDLHWGNILISNSKCQEVTFLLNGQTIKVPSKGIQVSIIDFTLSRMDCPALNIPIFYDLAKDDTLFTAQGDYQFEVYRQMKLFCGNDWSKFRPKTNVVWLHYVLDKLCTMARYRSRNTKLHMKCLSVLLNMRSQILQFPDTCSFIKSDIFVI